MRQQRRMKIRNNQRNWRSRRNIFGTEDKPRMVVYKSGNHIYSQIIDDIKEHCIVAASTLSPQIKDEVKGCSWNKKGAEKVGELIAKMAKEKGISRICFDRNGFKFHGRVKVLADSARKNGLEF